MNRKKIFIITVKLIMKKTWLITELFVDEAIPAI